MATIASGGAKKEYKLIPAGTHVANCYKFMNMGKRFQMFEGKKKEFPDTLVNFTFEVPGETDVFTYKKDDGSTEEVEKPLVLSREFTLSMGSKSNLRPFVEGMIGVTLKDEEAYSFDLESLVGKTCLITVVHKASKKTGQMYANITGTSPLMKGMVPPTQVNKSQIFNINDCTEQEVDELPTFLRDKVVVSDEYRARFLPPDSPELSDGDVPF